MNASIYRLFLLLPRFVVLVCLGTALTLGASEKRVEEAPAPLLRGVLIDGAAPLFSLAEKSGGGSRWVGLGEEFAGWKLVSFDEAARVLTLARGVERREVRLDSTRTASGAGADRAATLAEADALLQKLRFEEMIEKSIRAQQEGAIKAMAGAMGGSEAENTRQAELRRRILDVMLQEMDLPGMREDVAKVYSELFTAAELQAQTDFYSTPAGQAMLEKQPMIQQRLAEIMTPRMMRSMPKVSAIMSEEMGRRRSAGGAADEAPGADSPGVKN